MNGGDMGVRNRYSVDLASQQLQQTHRKCHHRQSYRKAKAAATKAQQTQTAIATTKTLEPQIKNVQYPPKQQYSINNKKQQRKQQQQQLQHKLFKIQSGQQQQHIALTTKHKREKAKQRKCLNTTITTVAAAATANHNSIEPLTQQQQKQKPTQSTSLQSLRHLASSKRFSLKRFWTLLLLSLTCLSTWSGSAVTTIHHPNRSLWLPSVASMASLALSQTSLVLAAATYEPAIQYHHSDSDVEVSDGMAVEDIDVNSNEQQLLAYYKQAQKKHEQLKRQQQQEQQQQQQRHHHQERDIKRNTVVLSQQMDFNDILPTADVISTLDSLEATSKKKSTATKRSTTKHAPPPPTPTSGPKSLATTASTTTTTTTTASSEEKCEPKILDEVPAEPYYDFSDVAEDAARQFTDFLASKFSTNPPAVISDQIRDEVRRKANGIATYALNEDEHLLAFALAAPSIHTVVVKFRENVTIPLDQVHNRGFLGSYWRELGYAWNSSDGSQEWGAPFRDCNLLIGRWLWPFRISFAESKFKIVAAAFIAADEDVCNDGLEQIFGRKHGCDRNTTFCLLTENKPAATRDVYTCICKESYYLPNSTLQGFRGDIVEMSEGYDNYSCIPCPAGCSNCDSTGVCLYGEPQETVSLESLLKVSVGSVLGACILCCVVLSVIVFQQRKCKAIASGMWTVLETILLGIVLLYSSVAIHFFPASTERCLIEPWLRELGFITCYGAIILKLYRHLVDFRTRKAHRWVLRDVDLLKYLGTMVFAVVCYMSAFTASSLDLLETAQLESLREVNTNTCQPLKWEFVTQASEILILCFGLHLAYGSRNANTQFRERQFLVTTLIIEFIVSLTFYILRYFYLPAMSPSAIFLALFLRSQLTNTIALGLIFVPKLWYQHKQGSHDVGQRLGGGYAGLCLGDPDIGELTISEMSPEDIRAELKRLYTQLEILKNKTLRQDNPHISKRRGGRKAGHRRFSLQKKGSKDKALSAKHRSNKHHQDMEITEAEPSRTPEDSVCSNEGPTDTYAEISGISHSMLTHSAVSHSIVSHSK
ncbi:metabotropic glycine receptor isoform X3 [Calliphora vicina]|uniref:metabotropic glycine receptor isoform X3 n=1 Tax=Calliphora vicina TaxID=7373 RepID=UPI00325B2463